MVIVHGDEILKINKDIDCIMANTKEISKERNPPTTMIGSSALMRVITNN